MGRPLLNSSARRRNPVTIYFDDRQYQIICRIAREGRKPISTYLREIVLKECKEKEGRA